MSNFAFLHPQWPDLYQSARRVEANARNDARMACFYARYTLEQIVAWLYDHDRAFRRPYDDNLAALLGAPAFRQHVPDVVRDKAYALKALGNAAAHDPRPLKFDQSLLATKDLYHILYWFATTYTNGDPAAIPNQFEETKLPPSRAAVRQQTLAQLQELERELEERDRAISRQQSAISQYEKELAELRAQVAQQKAVNVTRPRPAHDYSEAETRRLLIDVYLREAGWNPDAPHTTEYKVAPMPNHQGFGFADYVLWGDDGKPLAVVEAKRTGVDPHSGQQQAKLYADALQQMTGQRPLIFTSNGYSHWLWDDSHYPPRLVQGFYTRPELERLMQRRSLAAKLDTVPVNQGIVDRYYQAAAIRALTDQFRQGFRKGLIVMATGTGKTRTVIALCDLLMRANWVKRVLFLADRDALVRQAVKAFKKHLPTSNPLNLLEDKEAQDSRVVVSTYQTMIKQIDRGRDDGTRLFGPGHFDLLIIDEAHRSIYQQYGAIFTYFDSLLVGLTATPRSEVDRNTYRLFELEDGVPTYAYDLEQAVADGFLVPAKAIPVPLKFLRQGIIYDELPEAEKEEWDALEWDETGNVPDKVDAAALNAWLFNEDTVDKVLQTLMEHGLKVKGGDRLGKTIIFAKNRDHARFIQQRFDKNYPHQAGKFARVIVHGESYAHTLIDEFAKADDMPHIAISVDMLDTGIDIPEVVNLVFFKLVRSKTKFFQMIGRGTRLCPDLFGPGRDKTHFAIFDFCQNFEFFTYNPQGIETRPVEPLSQRLFKLELDLFAAASHTTDPTLAPFTTTLADGLHRRVEAMPLDNFIVRPQREHLEPFRERGRWASLSAVDKATLAQHVSGLPTTLREEPEAALRFDLLVRQLQLELLSTLWPVSRPSHDDESHSMLWPVSRPSHNEHGQETGSSHRVKSNFDGLRGRVIEIAAQLATIPNIPQIAAQLPLLHDLQTDAFWQDVSPARLEDVRLRLRGLVHLITRQAQKPLFTDFTDELGEIAEVQLPYIVGGVNKAQYRYKVEQFIREHEDFWLIQRIKQGHPLTPADLETLQSFFFDAAEVTSREMFEQLIGPADDLGLFIRQLVGLDRAAAKQAFARFLDNRLYNARQIQFVNHIIEHLTASGIVPPDRLYERPFTDLHSDSLDGLFRNEDANALLATLRQVNGG